MKGWVLFSFQNAERSAAAQTLLSAFHSNLSLFRKFPVTNIYNKGKPREVYLDVRKLPNADFC